jgi:hypothetical protein
MSPEEELRDEIQHKHSEAGITIEVSSEPYFEALQRHFPVRGSKIDWDKVPGARIRQADTVSREEHFDKAMAFTEEILETERLDRECHVTVIGDSAMEGALKMRLWVLRSLLDSILRMPQHTYVLGPDTSWCLVFSMEGDLCFGYAPS